ncbi:MAG: polysaccharide deacetylase family protein [Ruminiclostridium sp.]|nr:polysaccharide deacetylase family protein [Ruminiclostridium sp.]
MDKRKTVALTFDDGPNTVHTGMLIDLLAKLGVPSSFFLVGENITPQTAGLLKRAHELGIELANHSFTHRDMTAFSPDEVKSEIARTSALIHDITGYEPRFFRPPYIAVNDGLYGLVGLPFICGVGCNDWDKAVSVEERLKFLTEDIPDGCIILLHDQCDNPGTPEALKRALPRMLDDGYDFVTISELFRIKGVTPEVGKMYSVL